MYWRSRSFYRKRRFPNARGRWTSASNSADELHTNTVETVDTIDTVDTVGTVNTIGTMSLIATHLSARWGIAARLELAEFARHARRFSESSGGSSPSSYLPQWMKSRLPSALGGDRETLKELENLTMDEYRRQITAARKLGSISGSAFGAKASDAGTQGFLRNSERVVGALTDAEKASESVSSSRAVALARELDLSVEQVDAVMGRFKYTKHMMSVLAQRKRQGMEMPTTIEEVEQLTGNWRSFIAGNASGGAGSSGGGIAVPAAAEHAKGGPCGLAGMTVGRSTKCPRTRKSYKACCGRRGK